MDLHQGPLGEEVIAVSVWDLYSKRLKRKEREGQEDVFQYDTLPDPFRVQVVHILLDTLGKWTEDSLGYTDANHPSNKWWQSILKILLREKGAFQLTGRRETPDSECVNYLLRAATLDTLDVIELGFRFIDRVYRQLDDYSRRLYRFTVNPDEAIQDLNIRFREHGIGFEFHGGKIIRVDSEFLHAEVVKPAIQLLQGAGTPFAGPLEEFLNAHEKYRKGEDKDAIASALKAFESTLKAICTVRRWPYNAGKDAARQLLDVVFAQGLIPEYLQSQFGALKSVMESGVPRNAAKDPQG
jgi:hypothetical protein